MKTSNLRSGLRHFQVLFALLVMSGFVASSALAADEVYKLVIKDHRFQPTELMVPAGKKIKLSVENQDSTPEEFESHDLNREKLIGARATVQIFVGPLVPGRYKFYGEFNEKTAQGVIVVQ